MDLHLLGISCKNCKIRSSIVKNNFVSCAVIQKNTTIAMRYIFVITLLLCGEALLAQSKKQLQAEVASLESKIDHLSKQIEALKNPAPSVLKNEHQKASYGLGVLMASNLKKQGADSLEINILNEAMRDVLTNQVVQMEVEEAMSIVQPYMTKAMELKIDALKEEGLAFLNANKEKQEVIVTESGLQYKVLVSGNGKAPTPESSVTVHYTGKLLDGTIFDSSVERGQPATFGVSQVIAGWTEALQLMHEGDQWELYIPSELAYGERGAGADIPPYATLIFNVELIKVN